MEAWLSENYEQDQSIPRKGSEVEAAEGDGDPGMGPFKTRDPSQEESREGGVIVDWHYGVKEQNSVVRS